MNIVEIIRSKISNNPIEIHNLELQDIKIITTENQLYFEKLLPEVVKKYVTSHKLISFNNETYHTKEDICLFDKTISNNNVGFIKETDGVYKIEPAATCWKDGVADDTKRILKLLDIKIIEDDISYYNNKSATVIIKLIINHEFS